MVKKRWTVEIPEVPPSANPYMRMHFREQKKAKGEWYVRLYEAFFWLKVPPATKKRTVKITIQSSKERDRANLWLGADKLILDNLTKLRVIVDDSPQWIEIEVRGQVGEPRTTIEVSE